MTRAEILARYTPEQITAFGKQTNGWKGGLTPWHLADGFIVCPWCGHDLDLTYSSCGDPACCGGCWECECMASVADGRPWLGRRYRVYAEDDFEEVGEHLFMPKLLREIDGISDEAEAAWKALCAQHG